MPQPKGTPTYVHAAAVLATPALDPAVVSGDTVVVQAATWAGSAPIPPPEENWQRAVLGPGANIRNGVWARKWDGEPLSPWEFTNNGGGYLASSFWEDVHDDLFDAPSPAAVLTTVNPMIAPSIDVNTIGAAVLWFWTVANNNPVSSPTQGALLYGGSSFVTGTGGDNAMGLAWRLAVDPGPTGQAAATVTAADATIGAVLALKPATVAPVPPTVSTGPDTSVVHGDVLNIVAAETPNSAPIESREWRIVAGPAGVGTVLATTAALSWSPTLPAYPGAPYTLRYTGTSAAGPGSDDVVVEVIDPAVPRWRANLEVDGFGGFKANTAYDREPNGVMELVGAPVRDGTVAMRVGVVEPAQRVTGQQRSEHSPTGPDFAEGNDLWFGISIFLPSGFNTSPPNFLVFQQWKNNGLGSPPIALEVDGGRIVLACHYSGGAQAQRFDLGPAVTGEWIDLATRVKFSVTPAVGEVEVWRGSPTAAPTLALPTANPAGGTLYPRDTSTSYLKLGFYGDDETTEPNRVFILDAMTRGLTRASVTPPSADPRATPLFGLDVNRFRGGLNLATAQNEGLAFVLGKVGQGSSTAAGYGQTLDESWPTFRDSARAIGMPLGGYWYLGDTETPAHQAARCRAWIGDRGIPLALDWEEGGGPWSNVVACVAAFRAAGLTVRLLYTRATWHAANGGGSIADLDVELWSARYPSTSGGDRATLYAPVAADLDTYWQTYGGRATRMLQFTDQATAAGTSPVDLNAYDGDLADIETLLAPVPQPAPSPARRGAAAPLFPDRVVTP